MLIKLNIVEEKKRWLERIKELCNRNVELTTLTHDISIEEIEKNITEINKLIQRIKEPPKIMFRHKRRPH